MTKQPSVRQRVDQFMTAMREKNFEEAKRIRKFCRSMTSPQHWVSECGRWVRAHPDDKAVAAWFEAQAAEQAARAKAEDDKQERVKERPWSLGAQLQDIARANGKWWQRLD